MKIVIIIIFVVIFLFLQIGILPNLKIANVYPNLFLIGLIGLTILIGWKQSLGWIIATGLFLDFYSLNNILGISIFILLLTCIFSQFLNQRFLKKENKLSVVLIFTISLLFFEILSIILFKILRIESNFYLLGLIVKIIYSSILALPVFYVIKWYVDKIKSL